MSWWARLSLVALLTLATTVFMYEGWYKPLNVQAATVNYYMTPQLSTWGVGIDGAITWTALADITPGVANANRAGTTTTATTGTTRYRAVPAASGTQTNQEYFRIYTPAYTTNTTLGVNIPYQIDTYMRTTGTSASFALSLYDYDPAGAANNGVQIGSTQTITMSQANANVQHWSGNFANASAYSIATGHRLELRVVGTYTASQPAVLMGQAPSTTGSTTISGAVFISPNESTVSAPTLTTPTATTIASTTATLGANVTSDGGATVTERGVVWATTTAPTTADNKVTGTGTTGVYTVNATSLPANTRIYYRGYAINSQGTAYSPEGSFYTEPASQANTVTFSNVTQTGMTVNWNRGTGTGVIVVMKSGSAVDTAPADGNDSYTANSIFGTGSVTGGTNYVVYKGNGTAVTVTGLTASTTYHVAVYEYSGSGNDASPALGINYLLTPATGNQATASPCAAGTPTALTVGTETTSAVPLTWTTGASTNYFIVYRNGSQIATNVLTPSYTDNSVTPGAAYSYTVSGYNNAGTCSSAQSASANAYVIPLTPSIPTTANPGTGTTLQVTIGTDTNDSSVLYAIRVNGTQWVQSSGALGGTAFWQSKSNWGTKTVTGLTANTDYTFDVAARNTNPTPDTTGYGPSKLQRTTITMPTTITSCSGCHENPPTDTGITTRSGGEFAGSHSKHAVTLGLACTVCHVNNGTNYNHSNGLIQMAGSGSSYTKGTSFAINNAATLTGGTCSSLYCHSNGTGGTSQAGETRTAQTLTSPSWGGSTTCTTCHGNPPAYTNYTSATAVAGSKANAHQGTTHAAQACTVCHDTTTGNHGNGLYSINGSLGYTYNARRGGTCATPGCHGSVNWGGKLGCVDCHSQSYTRTKGAVGATLAAVKGEFGLAWGHKKTGRGAVTDADCIVCHLEGVYSTQKPSSTYHQDGNIDLRDPDGNNGEIPITNINNQTWTFQRFSTSYASGSRTVNGHTANKIDNIITQKFCLKCHDSNGATNNTARTGTSPTQYFPFGTERTNNTTYYTVGLSAGVAGGVVDVATQFAKTNRSRHPVFGSFSSGYPSNARLATPYKLPTDRTLKTKSASVVINCFDCHNVAGTGTDFTVGLKTTRTIVAHGNAVTVRGTSTVSGTPAVGNAVTLCTQCHLGYSTNATADHGAGSAIGTSGTLNRTQKIPFMQYGCNVCHSSGYDTARARPIRGEDVHGFSGPRAQAGVTNLAPAAGGAWAAGRYTAFIRIATFLTDHRPQNISGTTYSPQCNMAGSEGGGVCTNQGAKTYSTTTDGGYY